MSSKKSSDVVFRKSKGGDEDCEIESWDDTVLMKAYDVSVSAATEIFMSQDEEESPLSQEEEEETDSLPEGEVVWQRKPGIEVREHPETSRAKKSKIEKEFCVEADSQWNIGDECMAIYYSDNLYYKASVVSVHHNTDCAVVNFTDYNEEAEVSLKDIYPITMFINEVEEEFVEQNLEQVKAKSSHKNKKPRPKRQKQSQKEQHQSSETFAINPSLLFPPPPPMENIPNLPNMFSANGLPPHSVSMPLPDINKEALSSMLVSWYMAGYHTGYYRGLNSQLPKLSKSKNQPR